MGLTCFPIAPDGPAIVRVNLFVRSIATISDIKMVSALQPSVVHHNQYVYIRLSL